MDDDSKPNSDVGLTQGNFALIAGFGLLVMVFAAPIANFYFMPQNLIKGDMAATVNSLQSNGAPFLIGTCLLFVTYVMDIIVAWALFWYLRKDQKALSQLVAWSRLVYTALAFVGLGSSIMAYDLAVSLSTSNSFSESEIHAMVFHHLSSAKSMESMALTLFGVHLGILSILLWRSKVVPNWLSLPVGLAGGSYIAMYLGKYFAPDVDLGWLILLALGELALMVWLLACGWREQN
ncbi:DUF4386 domain-containing protein [Simiduia litorea]|uniref:DUF4386 domain-containing protein n=1 Tax=Simiduia litorea TaxID=1435348 RepID=UPI0036F1C49A